MKPRILILSLLLPLTGFAQPYSIDWHKVSGGGGTSANGTYTLSGTIGQPDAGATMNGGGYALSGGFWTISAVQNPGAPLLSIKITTGNTVQVYWPSPSAGFSLQMNSSAGTTNWVTATDSVTDNGTIRSITVSPATGNRYYRLVSP
jgi:hypothetical protein